MVSDFCIDALNSIDESRFDAKRCVQCGEVVDSVILENRGARQEPMTVQLAGRMRSRDSRRKINRSVLTQQPKGSAMKPREYSRDKGADVLSPTIGGAATLHGVSR